MATIVSIDFQGNRSDCGTKRSDHAARALTSDVGNVTKIDCRSRRPATLAAVAWWTDSPACSAGRGYRRRAIETWRRRAMTCLGLMRCELCCAAPAIHCPIAIARMRVPRSSRAATSTWWTSGPARGKTWRCGVFPRRGSPRLCSPIFILITSAISAKSTCRPGRRGGTIRCACTDRRASSRWSADSNKRTRWMRAIASRITAPR